MAKPTSRYAHTPPYEGGPYHLISTHTLGVHSLVKQFAEPLGLDAEACLAALLHDLGKYGELFQRRLLGEGSGIDHWTAGAWVALSKFCSVEVALAIQGHHIGLQQAGRDSLSLLDPARYKGGHRRLSESDVDRLLERQSEDEIELPNYKSALRRCTKADGMLRTRMLFSTLVDADFLDTESHFARTAEGPKELRPPGPPLEVDRALEALNTFVKNLQTNATASIKSLRDEVSDACIKAAEHPTGLFTLTAPTGSGKTLAMLTFALLHAKKHNLRRIVVVLPFLTLIDQTAQIYREIFKGFGEHYVLEDHSLARESDDSDRPDDRSKLLAENWDAPIVITTNVRFFEALHHNRPSVCRKLHRLAQSVVLCDEIQTLPLNVSPPKSLAAIMDKTEKSAGVNLVAPTLATLASLSANYGTTTVFATATQPAFGEFGPAVRELCPHDWQPIEIMPSVADTFKRSRRVSVDWRFGSVAWEQIAEEVATQPGTLVIVNTRREASELTAMIAARLPSESVLHLSTNMCVAHRQQVLRRIKHEHVESTGFLVATQCVEAGVDLDFRQVYRAWAPLDSIAQAAGRCNRNGISESGKVVVFLPENARYPLGGYKQAVQAAMNTVRSLDPDMAALHDPDLFRAFFKRLYDATGAAKHETVIEQKIKVGSYADLAQLYRLIPESGDSVIVRIGDRLGERHRKLNEKLLDRLENEGLIGNLMRKLRPYTVSTFTTAKSEIPLTPLSTRQGDPIPNWFLVNDPAYYDPTCGLLAQSPDHALITP